MYDRLYEAAADPAPADDERHPRTTRRRHASAALRERELQWWREHGDIEESFTWVLPPEFEPPARGRCFTRVAEALAACRHIVDYGCGNGRVTRWLRQRSTARITGLDISPTQVERARTHQRGTPPIHYRVIDGPDDLPDADGYLLHGLMNHLPGEDIDALLASLQQRAERGATLVVVEPVCFPGHVPDARDIALIDAIGEVLALPALQARAHGVTGSARVAGLRERIARRWWGELPYGPSPLQRPFEHDELRTLLAGRFEVEQYDIVQYLGAAQSLGSELALLALDAPSLAHTLAAELMPQIDRLERTLLRFGRLPDTAWYLALAVVRIGAGRSRA